MCCTCFCKAGSVHYPILKLDLPIGLPNSAKTMAVGISLFSFRLWGLKPSPWGKLQTSRNKTRHALEAASPTLVTSPQLDIEWMALSWFCLLFLAVIVFLQWLFPLPLYKLLHLILPTMLYLGIHANSPPNYKTQEQLPQEAFRTWSK
jgi:hypothetical protein